MIKNDFTVLKSSLSWLTASSAIWFVCVAPASAQSMVMDSDDSNILETTEILQTITLDKFDTSLGTLTGVKLTLGGQSVTAFDVENTAAQAQTFQITDTTGLFLTDGADNTGLTLTDPNTASIFDPIITFGQSTGAVSIEPNDTEMFGPFDATDETDYLFPPNGDLSFFLGGAGDTFTLEASTLSGFSLQGGGGNLVVEQMTDARFFGSVMYTYEEDNGGTTTPEPSTMLGLAAMTGLGFLAKRKNS